MDSIDKTTQSILDFSCKRDWFKFHTPKNLAESISIEAAELLELFQFDRIPDDQRVKEELADVAIYLFELASIWGIDLLDAIQQKLIVNANNYPVADFKGSARKYNE